MKKLVLLLAVVFSASMFACKSTDSAATDAADSAVVVEEAVEVVEAVAPVDSAATDSVAAPADSAVVAE